MDTWRSIGERKDANNRLLSAKLPRLMERVKEEYKAKDIKVKRSAQRDKWAFIENLSSKAEQAAAKGELNKAYKITKQLCAQHNTNTTPVKDKHGKVISTKKEHTQNYPTK